MVLFVGSMLSCTITRAAGHIFYLAIEAFGFMLFILPFFSRSSMGNCISSLQNSRC